jgi:hypothetical protein
MRTTNAARTGTTHDRHAASRVGPAAQSVTHAHLATIVGPDLHSGHWSARTAAVPPFRPACLFAAVTALALPAQSLADEPVRPPQSNPDEFPEADTRGRIASAGIAITAGFYGAALGSSYLWPESPGAEDLRIPVAGPWIALADTGCPDHDPNCKKFMVVIRAVLTTLDGIAQAGGLGVALESAFMPTKSRRAASTESPTWRPLKPRRVRAVPFTGGRDAVGIGIVGRF